MSQRHPDLAPRDARPSVAIDSDSDSRLQSQSPSQSKLPIVTRNTHTSLDPPSSTFVPQPSASSSANSTARRKPYALNGKQITRSRVSYSCHTCRRRKVKCDKSHPICGNCVKTGAECVYDSRSLHHHEQRAKRRRGASGSGSAQGRRLPDVPLDELQGVRDGLKELQGQDDNLTGAGSGQIAARLDRLTSMIERLSQTQQQSQDDGVDFGNTRSSSPNQDSGSDEFPIPAGLETDLVDPVGTLNLGHLSLDECGKSQYVGTTYFAYISDEINDLNRLLREQNRSQDHPNAKLDSPEVDNGAFEPSQPLTTNDRPMRGSDFFAEDSPSSNSTTIVPEILDRVPTRRQSNILYKGFMSGVQAISPVVHPPTVLKLYEKFWEWYDHRAYTGEPCPKPSFIPLIYAIWYGGSVTISLKTIHAEFDVETRSMLSGPFHDEVTRWLKKISFPRNASLHGLAAFLLVQTILSKEEEPLTSSLFVSLALRVAQTMGLHRDPAQFGIPPCEAETRRRVWWHIIHMDGVVAMSSGLPPQVSDENYWDVRLTSEVKDTLIGTEKANAYEREVRESARWAGRPDGPSVCGNSMVNVHYISAKGKYFMAQAMRKILRIQLGIKPVTRKDMEDLRSILIDLQAKLHALVDRIPEPKRQDLLSGKATMYSTGNSGLKPDLPSGGPGCMEQYHTPVLAAFHKWARILLSLFVHKAFCVAYQPFLKNAKSKIWPAARQCALRHCHGFMEKFILLATDPDFQPFQWSWPGNHQPMHATMIMLIDLYIHPTSPEAPKSRAFIDRIFSLSGPDGGVVGGEDGVSTARPLKDGGREAWDMMRRLREKAWLKVGLDPGVLWTEQAQARVRVQSAGHGKAGEKDVDAGTGRQSFADGYYAMIKEGYDGDTTAGMHPRNVSSRRPFQSSPTWVNAKMDANMSDAKPIPHTIPSTTTGQGIWPTPSLFPNLTSPPAYPDADIPDFLSNPKLLPAMATTSSPDISLPFPDSNINTNNPNNPLRSPPPLLSQQSLPDFSSTTVDSGPNINFDWDQWDAVFGEYLPVVDGFMDLDGPAPRQSQSPPIHQRQHQNQHQHQRSQSQMHRSMGSMAGMMGNESYGFDAVQDQKLKNWADFG